MTHPYDVEQGLRELAEYRDLATRGLAGDVVSVDALRLAGITASAFRADFDMTLDMEDAGKALVALAAHLVALAQQLPDVSRTALINAVGLAGEDLVRTARARAADASATVGETGPVTSEFVLSWHPLTADPSEPIEPIEVPLNMHVDWCPEELGEFRVFTREVGPADEAPEVSGG